MKYLLLVRHAKSSWKLDVADFQRPLNKRGETDAPKMAKRLEKQSIKLDLLLSSTAVRALSTAKILAKSVSIEAKKLQKTADIYLASENKLLKIIKNLDDNCQYVGLVGHNPGLTTLTHQLTGKSLDNIPTCGMAYIQFDVDNWQAVDFKKGKLLFFDFPKKT
jgi:phosphohistidine phosphatase